MKSSTTSVDAPFASGAGLPAGASEHEDPYRALDELMVVVEALCPEWPRRGLFSSASTMLL